MALIVPLAACGALAVGVGLILALHVLPPTSAISPVRRTISEYALGPGKTVFDLGVLLVALGSAVVFAEVVRRGHVRAVSVPVLLGTVWTASLLVVVVFTKNDWSVGPSVGGMVHRYASVAGFVCLPFAVIALAGAVFPRADPWRWAARGLGVVSLAWFGVLLVGVARSLTGGGPWWRFVPLGLVERAMALSAVAAIGVLALGLARPRA